MNSATHTTWDLQHAWPIPTWGMAALVTAVVVAVIWLFWQEAISVRRKLALLSLRLVAVVAVFLMLGGWKLAFFETERPDLLLVVDRSLSMQLPAGESAADVDVNRLQRAKQLIQRNRWLETLADRYHLTTYTIGEKVDPASDFTTLEAIDNESRLGDGLLQLNRLQRGRSTAAMVLLTDGIVTSGRSLADAGASLSQQDIPLWVIGLGSDQPSPEVAIEEVLADDRAFLGDEVRVDVRLKAVSVPEGEVTVVLKDRDSGTTLATQRLAVASDSTRISTPLPFAANRPGLQNLEVVVEPLAGEVFDGNNRRRFSVLVRDDPVRVLLIADQPSYEFRFLKHLLERARGKSADAESLVELISVLQSGDPRYAQQDRTAAQLPPIERDALESLDVVILCDADLRQLGDLLLSRIDQLVRSQGLGLIVVAGPEHALKVEPGSPLIAMLPIDPSKTEAPTGVQDRPLPVVLTNLAKSTGELSLPAGLAWEQMPPIFWLMQTEGVKPTASVLLAAPKPNNASRLPQVLPVVASQIVGAGQVWLQLTDETFRWQVASPEHNLHERYWLQTIRRLARRKLVESSDRAELMVAGQRFITGDSIDVQLKLASGMALQQARIEIERTPGGNETSANETTANSPRLETLYPSTDGRVLQTSLQNLPTGEYALRVVDPDLNPAPDPVVIQVEALSTELVEGRAAIAELSQAARLTGGELLTPAEASGALLDRLPVGRSTRLNELPSKPIWNHWLVALLVVGALCGEWILRRRWGMP